MDRVERAFQETSFVLFGKRLSDIDGYADWLKRETKGTDTVKSRASGKSVCVPEFGYHAGIKNSLVTLEESLELGKKSISEGDVVKLSLSDASIVLSGIRLITTEIVYGKNIGTRECCGYGPTENCYRATFCWHSKLVGYSFNIRTSECLFGCQHVLDSAFCMKCYGSTKLTRCFEVNDSNACSDCYFCHNCEGLLECILCFNVKAKRYAIGNVEYPREQYLALKKRLLAELAEKLEADKGVELAIYRLGGKKKEQSC